MTAVVMYPEDWLWIAVLAATIVGCFVWAARNDFWPTNPPSEED